MPVPASITELSTTASNNSPAGSESPTTTDDYLRTLASFIATLRDNKQPLDALLTALAALTASDGQFLALTGADTVAARNILGTVSQSDGVPTGAIIERGSNAGGEYIRWADGTQICTVTQASSSALNTATGNLYRTGSNTWTYPAAFVGAPVISGMQQGSPGYSWISEGDSIPKSASCSWAAFSAISSTSTPEAGLTAKGRWF